MGTGHKPSLDHHKVFRCLAHAHVKQGKLETRAKKCLFIGYPSGVKAYKLWNLEPEEPITIVTRNVTFEEESTTKLANDKSQHDNEQNTESVQVEITGITPYNSQEPSDVNHDIS